MAPAHRPLDPARSEIRLVKLMPAETIEAPVSCRLEHASLDDAAGYEALSYTWGLPEFTERIELESRGFFITSNLDTALRHLRLPASARTLWIDAICINQEDWAERSQQVRLMKRIYESCIVDLVWLGPNHPKMPPPAQELPDSQAAFERKARQLREGMELIRNISNHDINTLEILEEHRQEVLPQLARYKRHSLKDGGWYLTHHESQAVKALFLYPLVWNRVWVMQELACAPRVVLVAARATLVWGVVETFLGDAPFADAFHMAFPHNTVAPMVHRIFGPIQIIRHQRAATQAKRTSSLLDVLALFKLAKATDPRDKIYGLLGLVSDSHRITVDYSKTTQEVFADVAVFLINSSRNLDLICQSPFIGLEIPKARRGLPQSPESESSGDSSIPYSSGRRILEALDHPEPDSWIPDFASTCYDDVSEQYSSLLFAQRGIYSAGTPECQVPCDVRPGMLLSVRGTIIGQMHKIHALKKHRFSRGAAFLVCREWMTTYFGSLLLRDNSETYFNGEPAWQAFWRTLVADATAYPITRLSQEQIASDGKLFQRLLRIPTRLRSPHSSDSSDSSSGNEADAEAVFLQLASKDMLLRMQPQWHFTVTDTGLYMIFDSFTGVAEGDLVAVVDGGKVPLVLRKLTLEDDEVGYAAVSPAYVHGFMDSLAQEWVRTSKLIEQEFLLV